MEELRALLQKLVGEFLICREIWRGKFDRNFAGCSWTHKISSKPKGPGEKGAPRNHPEISSQKLADFECRVPYDSYGKNRAPFWPFLGEGLWGNIRRPLLLLALLVYG